MKNCKLFSTALLLSCLLLFAYKTSAQVVVGGEASYDIDYLTPKQYEIGGFTFENADNFDTRMILLVAGLQVGDKITVPGDRISTAIDNLWRQGMFEDVQILTTRIQGDKIFLKILLKERPKLTRFSFKGVKKNDVDKLRKDMQITVGDAVTENLIATTSGKIRSHYIEKGYTNVSVDVVMTPDTTNGATDKVMLLYDVKLGKRVKIEKLSFEGNQNVSTNKLLQHMKNTHDVHYAKKLFFWTPSFWKRSKYRESFFQEDLDAVIAYYNELGYRDARVVSDTVYTIPSEKLQISSRKKKKQDRLAVNVKIHEGRQYFFRDISFTGNTVYADDVLRRQLRIEKGAPYNQTQLETNLNYNPSGTDISSMYMDNGYLFFNITPVEVAVDNDSIDIEIRIVEGKQAIVRNVKVEGNTITNDRIVMRELQTRPGDLFSREAVLRSRRELAALRFFKEESLIPEPKPNRDDGTVDIVYKVEENQTSQIMAQLGYGQMLYGQIGLTLNNFSVRNIFNKAAWQPLPAGDGQQLSLNFATNAIYYSQLSASFLEPWLGGHRPQALSFGVYHTWMHNGFTSDTNSRYYAYRLLGVNLSLTRRLKWPDDYFVLSQGLSYKHYNIVNGSNFNIENFEKGVANDISYGITLSRNSYDSPIYTRSGSDVVLSFSLTPPYSLISGKDFSAADITSQDKYRWLEYYKINIKGSWMLNLVGDIVLNTRFRFGYMGAYNKDIGLVPFGRYYVGGDGLTSYQYDGREIIPLRGYDNYAISPTTGAAVFDRYSLELRQPIVENSGITLWAEAFFEGGNAWSSIKKFQPFDLYNSAGLGIRFYSPIFGLIGIDWGYGFQGGSKGGSHFHFSIGQSLD